MKLLLDQNISFRVLPLIAENFTGSIQVREAGLEDHSDFQIGDYARTNGFTIVTFDSDFQDISVLRGAPPKIIWLRTGNLPSRKLAEFLNARAELIQLFIGSRFYDATADDMVVTCLELI